MADPKNQDAAADGKKQLTAADAAKLVKRPITVKGDDDKPVQKLVAIKAEEVLGFRDYGSHVVVVTSDSIRPASNTMIKNASNTP